MPDVGGIAGEQLKSFIERIERLEEEKRALSADIKDVYAEAKGSGFDTAIMRQIIRIRRMDQDDVDEQETLLDIYKRALGMLPDGRTRRQGGGGVGRAVGCATPGPCPRWRSRPGAAAVPLAGIARHRLRPPLPRGNHGRKQAVRPSFHLDNRYKREIPMRFAVLLIGALLMPAFVPAAADAQIPAETRVWNGFMDSAKAFSARRDSQSIRHARLPRPPGSRRRSSAPPQRRRRGAGRSR